MQQFTDILNPDNKNIFLLSPVLSSVTVGLILKPDIHTYMAKVKYVRRSEVLLMIKLRHSTQVVDCYHSPVLFFVHIHMKQSYENSRKSKQEICVTTEHDILVFSGGFVSTMILLLLH
jgi:hypothetical protein